MVYHVDATYKLLKHFFPVIIFGATDRDNKFFPIAFMITSHETSEDYTHFFAEFKKVAKQVLNVDFDPQYIMADAGSSIHNGIKANFPNTTQLMCYFHVRFNLKKHIIKKVPAEKRKVVNKIIEALHDCATYARYKKILG